MFSQIRVVLIGLLALSAIASCSRPTQPTSTLKVGVLKHESTLPYYVAEDSKLFERHGVSVELIELPPGDHLPALLSRRVDLISPTSFTALFGAMAQEPDLLYALVPGAEVVDGPVVYGFIVRSDFSGSSVRDFTGKVVIAINPFTQINIQTIFSSARIPKQDWPDIRVASRDAALTAVESGAAVAAIMDQPALAVALQEARFKMIEPNPRASYIGSPYWSGAGAISRTTWTSRTDDVRKMLAAIDDAIGIINKDTTGAHRVLATSLGLDPKIADQCGGYYFPKSSDSVDLTAIQDTVNALIAAKVLTKDLKTDDIFPPGLYKGK